MKLKDYIDDIIIIKNVPEHIAPIFKKHNATVFELLHQRVPDGYQAVKVNHNPDLVRDLLLAGYTDLCMGNHKKYSHILEKMNSMIFVTKFLELHHYYG